VVPGLGRGAAAGDEGAHADRSFIPASAPAYSFGLDDQEFIVAYETDDLVAFQDLVRDLRATESRRSTVRDTPIVTGIRRPLGEILSLLSEGRAA
jgi:chlorite dismutase